MDNDEDFVVEEEKEEAVVEKAADKNKKGKGKSTSKAEATKTKQTIGPNETVKKFEEFAADFAKRWAYRDESKNFD